VFHPKIIVALLLISALSSCQIGRFIFYNFAGIDDHKKFQSRTLTPNSAPFQFHHTDSGRFPKAINNTPFADYLESNKTVGFLIIKSDTIQYQQYFKGYEEESVVPSFSMAKSVTSILIGCAIEDGLIGSVNDPVTKYVPELEKNGFGQVTLKHLLQMTSGMKFNESYFNPFGEAASYYYGRNLLKQIWRMKLETTPGTRFQYVSGSTQLLGLVLDRQLKDKSITEYLQEKLWTPLGMEHDASWSIDKKKNGLEKTFCCLNATALDYAKIGRLYLNNGKWNGQQLVPESWVKESTQVDTTDGSISYYQYQWWLPTPGEDFMAVGILGQYIYVNPKKDLVIVRLGKDKGKADWWTVLTSLAKMY
jgi:CubicO group peptidase (beta-lactamase class C family)